jgi:hypothetical protein
MPSDGDRRILTAKLTELMELVRALQEFGQWESADATHREAKRIADRLARMENDDENRRP